MRYYDSRHPLCAFIMLSLTIVIAMLTLNPLMSLISLFGSLLFCAMVIGVRELLKSLRYSAVMFILMSLVNPLFVHRGETPLFYLNNNPITLEAVYYGLFACVTLLSVFYLFKSLNAIIDGDKLLFIFGKVSPRLATLISAVLRFYPRAKRTLRQIDDAQKAFGMYAAKSKTDILKGKARVFFAMTGVSIEQAIDTADCSRSRGFSLKGRTCCSRYSWRIADTLLIIYFSSLFAAIVSLLFCRAGYFVYYPIMTDLLLDAPSIALYCCTAALMMSPFLLEATEKIRIYLLLRNINGKKEKKNAA